MLIDDHCSRISFSKIKEVKSVPKLEMVIDLRVLSNKITKRKVWLQLGYYLLS